MEDNNIGQKFMKVAGQYGDFDDSLPAYVSLLYLNYLNQNPSERDELDLGKKAESIAKSYYQRFSGSSFPRLMAQIAELGLSQSGFRLVLSFLLSGAMSHFEASTSSSVEMAQLVSGLLDVKPGEVVLDFGSGNGSFLVSVEQNLPKASVKPTLIGIEPNANDALISQMALSMIGSHFEIQNRDGFSGDVPKFDKGYVFPPEGLAYNKGLLKGAEYINRISPKSSMEWAFVLRALESMSPKGKLVALLPESCLFRESDSKIREKLIEDGLIEGVISFPPKSMIGTFRKMNLVILSKGNNSVRVIDGQDLFKTVDVRSFNSMAVKALLYTYLEGNAEVIPYERIKAPEFALNLDSLKVDGEYDGLDNLRPLGTIYNIDKGTPKTIANFSESLSSLPTKWKILTSGHIENGRIDYDAMPYVYDDPSYERFEAVKGDIIITSKSSKVKIAIITQDTPYRICVTGAMLILRPRGEAVQLYTKLFLESEKGRRILASAQKGTVVTTLSAKVLNNLMVPFPPVEEQLAFIKEYETKSETLASLLEQAKRLQSELNNYFDVKSSKGE